MRDTIFAPATAPGRSAVAIVRVSGPRAGAIADSLTGGRRPPPRLAGLRRLFHPESGAVLDEALLLWMPAPASFTGEDQLELHLHGGPAVVAGVVQALSAVGSRMAEPGEFTRRAFEAGKLELSQAEAVADLVDAETEAQRRQALDQLGGALSRRHAAWREALLEAASTLEAAIDFPDEELPEDVGARAAQPIGRLLQELQEALADGRGERVREGFRVALCGPPNAGKSSLLNALLARDAAIVTDVAGTTRDVIEAPWDVAGHRVILADMAGLRETDDVIEAEGVRRARAWAEKAHLRLWLQDASSPPASSPHSALRLGPDDLPVLTKVDLAGARLGTRSGSPITISVLTGEGVERLTAELTRRVVGAMGGAEFPAATRLRHRELMAAAIEHLRRGLDVLSLHPEQAAEDVRLAARALGRISGLIGSEEVLDRIFASFCIGK